VNPSCPVCKRLNPAGLRFCFRCGAPVRAVVASSGLSRTQWLILGGAAVFLVVVVGISETLKTLSTKEALEAKSNPSRTAPAKTSPSATASTSPKTAFSSGETSPALDNEAAISSFRRKIMSLPESERMVLSIEGTPVKGVVRIQVSNLWFSFAPYQKRQLTQMFANAWSAELRGEPSILHIYDVTGREIAGTKAFGGVWVEEE